MKDKAQDQPRRKPSHGVAYTPEIAERILEQLAQGMGLRTICKEDGMPTETAVRKWVHDDVEGFGSRYARARAIGLDSVAEEIIDIADEAPRMTATKDGEQVDSGDVSHRKLRIDSRKWLLSKILPKKYGDKVEVEQTGEVKHTISFK